MKKIIAILLLLPAISTFITGCQKFDFWNRHENRYQKIPDAQVATDWYRLQLRFLLERNSTLNGAYFGYLGIGLYESLQPGIKDGLSFSAKLYQMPTMPAVEDHKNYDWIESANAAMASLLRYYNTGLTTANLASIDSLENAYNQKLNQGGGTESFARSQAFGKSIATAIYNWSLTDNFNPSNAGYVAPVFPGAWVPTPTAFANPVFPYISQARPFLAENASAIAPPPAFAYSEDPNSDFYKMMKQDYDVFNALTQEQKDIALFWVDQGNGTGYTPPGHDFSIITQAIEQTHVNLAIAAEIYAKAGIAERDATIVCFRSKYKYNQLRPVTYIQKLIDPAWLPFIPTPPHPEYPAAHAMITGAVMATAEKILGDNVKITDHSYDFRGWTPRTFNSLFQAAENAGISRLYGGIHCLPSINTGFDLAHDLGGKIGEIKLRD